MRCRWDAAFDSRLREHVQAVCDPARPEAARDAAWRALLAAVAPHVEAWARRSPLLRRVGLAGEDEARAVLLATIERLAANDFANLRRFLASADAPAAAADATELEDAETVERLTALTVDAPAPAPVDVDGDELTGTPLRAWLFVCVRFASKDHVKARLGWAAPSDEADGVGARSKRALGTDAERLDARPDDGARPPVTDWLTLRRVLAEITAHVATMPDVMRRALELWMQGEDYAGIARTLALPAAADAHAQVRAAQARLRERFRDRWPELVR